MNETTWTVIGFGKANNGFFNHFGFSSTVGYAYGLYQGHIADPEMDGAVIIEVEHETWKVIEEFGTEGVSVVYGPLGTFKVEKAPELVMV